MYITDVQIRDVVFQMEFTLKEATLIKKALENTTLELCEITNPVEKEEVSEALKDLYSLFSNAVNGAEEDER